MEKINKENISEFDGMLILGNVVRSPKANPCYPFIMKDVLKAFNTSIARLRVANANDIREAEWAILRECDIDGNEPYDEEIATKIIGWLYQREKFATKHKVIDVISHPVTPTCQMKKHTDK